MTPEFLATAAEYAEAALALAESLKHPKHADALKPMREKAGEVIARFFRAQCRAALKQLEGHLKTIADRRLTEADQDALDIIGHALPDGALLPLTLTKGMSADYSSALTSALNAGYDVLGADSGSEGSLGADAVEVFLRDNSLTKLTGDIGKTTVERLRNALADAYQAGGGYEEMVQAVRDEYEKFSTVRAGMIAQTEMNAAYNAGRMQLGRDLGFNEKSWNPDGEACPVCLANVAQGWIPMDEPFLNGADAPPEHPNCDCSIDVRLSSD